MRFLGHLFEILHVGAVDRQTLTSEALTINPSKQDIKDIKKHAMCFSLINQNKAKLDRHLANCQLDRKLTTGTTLHEVNLEKVKF